MAKKEGTILIVDDDPDVLLSGRLLLKRHFRIVQTERDPKRLPKLINQQDFDLILLDMNFNAGETDGSEGVRWMHRIAELSPATPVIMITAYGHIEMAVKAMKEGATDFVSKPWQNEKLLATVKAAYLLSQSKRELTHLQSRQEVLDRDQDQRTGPLIIGQSEAMQQIYGTLEKVAQTDANVLILGENGTGKELIARELHRQSLRHKQAFINVDLGAISPTLFESELFGHRKGAFTDAHEDRPGRFEIASDGTLFLDEIGNLTLPLQAKLLTVLQNRQVTRVGTHKPIDINIRLVCATNMPLYEMVKSGDFRQDLLYRINTVELELPSLRDRQEDIPLLIDHFLSLYGQKYQKASLRVAANTLKKLQKYHWPGNIRELRHAVERAVILSEGKVLQPSDFTFHIEDRDDGGMPQLDTFNLEEMEKLLIRKAITHHKGNISQAARDLGITRAALYRRMEKYGL